MVRQAVCKTFYPNYACILNGIRHSGTKEVDYIWFLKAEDVCKYKVQILGPSKAMIDTKHCAGSCLEIMCANVKKKTQILKSFGYLMISMKNEQ